MPRASFFVAAALLLTGCVSEQLVPWAYDVPIESNSKGARTAYNCVAACRVANQEGSTGFFSCLQTCPDIHVVEGAECAPHSPSESICYTQLVPEEVDDPEKTNMVLSLIGAILDIGSRVAEHESHHGEHHHEGHHHR